MIVKILLLFVAKKTLLCYNLQGLIRIRARIGRCAEFCRSVAVGDDGAERLKTTKKGENQKWQLYQ